MKLRAFSTLSFSLFDFFWLTCVRERYVERDELTNRLVTQEDPSSEEVASALPLKDQTAKTKETVAAERVDLRVVGSWMARNAERRELGT